MKKKKITCILFVKDDLLILIESSKKIICRAVWDCKIIFPIYFDDRWVRGQILAGSGGVAFPCFFRFGSNSLSSMLVNIQNILRSGIHCPLHHDYVKDHPLRTYYLVRWTAWLHQVWRQLNQIIWIATYHYHMCDRNCPPCSPLDTIFPFASIPWMGAAFLRRFQNLPGLFVHVKVFAREQTRVTLNEDESRE